MNSCLFINFCFFLYFYFHYTEAGFVEITMTTGSALNTTSKLADFSGLKVKKINRKHLVVGEFVIHEDVSNDINCTLLSYKKQGGEYRKTSFKLPMKGCCDFYNTEHIFMPDIKAHCAKCPKQSDNVCPYPKGSYIIDGFEIDSNKIPPNFEGDFKAVFLVTKNEEILTGYTFYAKVIR